MVSLLRLVLPAQKCLVIMTMQATRPIVEKNNDESYIIQLLINVYALVHCSGLPWFFAIETCVSVEFFEHYDRLNRSIRGLERIRTDRHPMKYQ